MARSLKTEWTALTRAQVVRVLADRGWNREGTRVTLGIIDRGTKGHHITPDDDMTREALISVGNTEPGMYDVVIRDLPSASTNVRASKISGGEILSDTGYVVSHAASNADGRITVHYRYHVGATPTMGYFVAGQYAPVSVLNHRFGIGDMVVCRVSGRTGRVVSLGKMLWHYGTKPIVPTVTIESNNPNLTVPESVTYPAQMCDPLPASTTDDAGTVEAILELLAGDPWAPRIVPAYAPSDLSVVFYDPYYTATVRDFASVPYPTGRVVRLHTTDGDLLGEVTEPGDRWADMLSDMTGIPAGVIVEAGTREVWD